MFGNTADLIKQITLGEDSVLELKPEMLARLIRFDEQTIPNVKVDELNPKLWQRFRTVISPT